MTATLVTGTLRDRAALGAIEDEWWALWARAAAATPFQSPAWLIAWWDAFAPGELSVVTVRRAGMLVGLAPLYIETGRHGRRALPIGISVSDYLDVLLDPDFVGPASSAVMQRLAREDWQSCELGELRADADAWSLSCPPGCREDSGDGTTCTGIALPEPVDDFATALPRGRQRKLRLARNRAARAGGFDFLHAESNSVRPLLSELVRLHGLRWQSRGEPGVLADHRVATFHRDAASRLMMAGLLRLYALRFAGRIAGVFYGFQHAGRTYAYLTGFDPELGFASPGTLLVAHALGQAIREGCREFDFLRGDEPFKRGWGAVPRRNRRRVFQRVADHALA